MQSDTFISVLGLFFFSPSEPERGSPEMGEGEPPAGGVSAGAGVFRSSESVRGLGGVLTIEVLAGRDLAPFARTGVSYAL